MNLSHALASALPPPGYNSSRPYCFSLTLPAGEMSFFQAGTDDLVQEWVSTCNYWAARRSRPPLPGGLGNVEYGWNRLLDSAAGNAVPKPEDAMSMRSNLSGHSRMSFQGTMGRRHGSAALIERMHIAEWRAPQPSLIPSPLDEETQLESLQKHVQSLKQQLEEHTLLEEPMSRMVSRALPTSRTGGRTLTVFPIVFFPHFKQCQGKGELAQQVLVHPLGDRKVLDLHGVAQVGDQLAPQEAR